MCLELCAFVECYAPGCFWGKATLPSDGKFWETTCHLVASSSLTGPTCHQVASSLCNQQEILIIKILTKTHMCLEFCTFVDLWGGQGQLGQVLGDNLPSGGKFVADRANLPPRGKLALPTRDSHTKDPEGKLICAFLRICGIVHGGNLVGARLTCNQMASSGRKLTI